MKKAPQLPAEPFVFGQRFGLALLRRIGLRLLRDDVDEIAHRDIHVDQMQTPILRDLAVRDDVTGNLVGAWIGRILLCRDLQIRAALIAHAFAFQQARHADERCRDLLAFRPFRRLIGRGDRAAGCIQVRMQIRFAAAEGCRVRACSRLTFSRYAAESCVRRRQNGVAERHVADDATDLRCALAQRHALERATDIFPFRHGDIRAEQQRRHDLRLERH